MVDGNGVTIEQNNNEKSFFGIIIEPNLKNITIKNLKIKNFTGGGIYCMSSTSDITFENLAFHNCGYDGLTTIETPHLSSNKFSTDILLHGSKSKPIHNVTIKNCYFIEHGIQRDPIKYELSTNN
ncbi:unnamed protein product, partial [marine sediment metagenome]